MPVKNFIRPLLFALCIIPVALTGRPVPAAAATSEGIFSDAPAEDTASIVRQIRSEFEAINNAKLKATTFKWEYDSTCTEQYEAGKVTLYTLNGVVVKVYSEGDAEHGSWKEEFYFKKDTLFFIYQNNAYGGAQNPAEFKYQNRYYLQDNELIKAIETGDPNDRDYVQRLMQTAYALRKAGSAMEVARIFSCGE